MHPVREFAATLARSGEVVFESWNGELRGTDSDALLYFRRDSDVILEERGVGIRTFEGSFRVDDAGLVVLDLPGFEGSWPTMRLGRDGQELVLHREDGHTSWLPPDFPDHPASVDGFWPFRESK